MMRQTTVLGIALLAIIIGTTPATAQRDDLHSTDPIVGATIAIAPVGSPASYDKLVVVWNFTTGNVDPNLKDEFQVFWLEGTAGFSSEADFVNATGNTIVPVPPTGTQVMYTLAGL